MPGGRWDRGRRMRAARRTGDGADRGGRGRETVVRAGVRRAFEPHGNRCARCRPCWRRAGRRARLWFVTRGAQALDATEAPADRRRTGGLWGSARVIAEEHPDSGAAWSTSTPRDRSTDARDALAGDLLRTDGEDQVGWRRAQRLRAAPRSQPSAPRADHRAWRADAPYLVTGGLGGVGLHLARAMVAAGARRLVLLGRRACRRAMRGATRRPRAPIGQRIAAVLELEAAGAAVHLAAVDVRDEQALGAFLDG